MWRALFFAFIALAGTLVSGAEGGGIAPRFDAFVNWDYRWRPKLRCALSTERLIRFTLEDWYPGEGIGGEVVENGTPKDLGRFLESLPGDEGSRFHLVYLSSHQSPGAKWIFANGETRSWTELLQGVSVRRPARRIVILDACFAEAVPDEWQALPSLALFACSAREKTYQVCLNRKQPAHFRKHYPAEVKWLEDRFGERWMRRDSRLSFLGFIWLRAYLKTPKAPGTLQEWESFLGRCEAEVEQFGGSGPRHWQLTSSIRMERTAR